MYPPTDNVKRCLEAHPLSLTKKLPRANRVGNLEETPQLGLGVAVPGHVGRSPGPVGVLQRHNGRVLVWQPSPVEAERAVVLHADAQGARIHIRVEYGRAVGSELSHGTGRTPVDKGVAAGEDLRGALALGAQVVGRKEGLDEIGGAAVSVDTDDLAGTGGSGVDLAAVVVLGAVGAVVVEAENFDAVVLREPAGVVLEAKVDAVPQRKGAVGAGQAPDNAAVSAVDLVHGAGVAGGDQVVALRILVDTVDVEVVPGVGAVVARSSLAGIDGEDGL